jgi:hypothetical protein
LLIDMDTFVSMFTMVTLLPLLLGESTAPQKTLASLTPFAKTRDQILENAPNFYGVRTFPNLLY